MGLIERSASRVFLIIGVIATLGDRRGPGLERDLVLRSIAS